MKKLNLLLLALFVVIGIFSCKKDPVENSDVKEADVIGSYSGSHKLAIIELSKDTLDVSSGTSETDGSINIYSRGFKYTFVAQIKGNVANIPTLSIENYPIASGEDTVLTATGTGTGTIKGTSIKTSLKVNATTTLDAPLNKINNGEITGTFNKL